MKQQTITLVLADGRRATYVGAVQLDDNSTRIVDVIVTPPNATVELPFVIEMPCCRCWLNTDVAELFTNYGECRKCVRPPNSDHYTGGR